MIINLVLDSAAQAAPVVIKNAWQAAANQFDNLIANNITVNIAVSYSSPGGGINGTEVSYSAVYGILVSTAAPGDATFSSLPSTNPFVSSTIIAWNAQAKALGLRSANDPGIDGSAGFSTDIPASLMTGVALREFGHILGRHATGLGSDIFDLFDFTGPGVRQAPAGGPPAPAGYFSLNNGLNRWANWGQNTNPADFLADSLTTFGGSDPFNETYNANTLQYLTPADMEELDALGYFLNRLSPAADGHDFDGDNNGDILLQNSAGQIVYAEMVGGANAGFVSLGNTPGYHIVGSGKIFGDYGANPVLQSASGQIIYERVVNGLGVTFYNVANTPGYSVVGVGDINRDLHEDIVLENSSGQTIYANMATGFFNGFVNVATVPGYTVRGVGDINDDGYVDVVFESSGGQIVYANMANGVFNGFVNVANAPGYTVVGAADISRDGFADLVLENLSTGQVVWANMSGGVFNGFSAIMTVPGYQVVSLEDVNGDGYADIVIENSAGQLVYQGSFQGLVNIGTVPGYTAHTGPDDGSAVGAADSGDGLGQTGAGPTMLTDSGADNSVRGVVVSDPGPTDGNCVPGITATDPGPDNSAPGINMVDPGPSDGGSVDGFRMTDPGPSGGGGGAGRSSGTPTNNSWADWQQWLSGLGGGSGAGFSPSAGSGSSIAGMLFSEFGMGGSPGSGNSTAGPLNPNQRTFW